MNAGPDILIFNTHVLEAGFQIGVDKGMWGIVDDDPKRPTWPFVIVWVKAGAKIGRPDKYFFRFTLNGYPSTAPTACPWNNERNVQLAATDWPIGGPVTKSIFNPNWKSFALYAPCDREAMSGHENWQREFPDLWWKSSFKIEKYLHFIHRNLNSSDYART